MPKSDRLFTRSDSENVYSIRRHTANYIARAQETGQLSTGLEYVSIRIRRHTLDHIDRVNEETARMHTLRHDHSYAIYHADHARRNDSMYFVGVYVSAYTRIEPVVLNLRGNSLESTHLRPEHGEEPYTRVRSNVKGVIS